MQAQNLIKIIKAEATVLTALIDNLPDDGQIQQFEVDMLIGKIQSLNNIASHLQAASEPQPVQVKTPVVEPVKQLEPEVKVAEPKQVEQNIVVEPVAEKVVEEEKPTVATIIEDNIDEVEVSTSEFDLVDVETEQVVEKEEAPTLQPQPVEKTAAVIESTNVANTVDSAVKTETKPTSTLADAYLKNARSVNDVLAGIEKRRSLASQFSRRPITNLRQSIAINDRIRFINQLFGRDNILYQQTLDNIEKSANIDDALKMLFSQFNWNQEEETVADFLELVYLRFSK
ncbi:MAG: hypothetical protein MJ069_01370 [Salinivirgaceae bacterium]|nr:hypothetical protein [Salinivirgaceae bacterium]